VLPTVRVVASGICIVWLVSACHNSGAGGQGTPTAVFTTPAAPTDSGIPVDAATRTAISHAYSTFFASTSTTAQSQQALQHGERFTKTLAEQAKSAYADSSSAAVNSVRLVRPAVAAVTFTITSGGSALLSKVPGYAVRTGTTWQVAAETFCALLRLQQDAPAACDDPTVTALPH
jgi:hypothetical protein